jgi:predicted ribosomally synthesized peptide with nif11-like leader
LTFPLAISNLLA